MGDIVQALPVLRALRRHAPAARIAWLVEQSFAPLLEEHPDLDELIPVRLKAWRRRPLAPRTLREIGRFLTALQEFSAEVVLDLMGNHKAGALAALTLADRRIGVARDYRREPSSALWLSESVQPRTHHSVDKMLATLDALGLPTEPAEFGPESLPAPGDDTAAETPAQPLVLIHPGAGWDNKRYPPAAWGRVAHLIRQTNDAECAVVVARGEEDLARQAVEASQGAAQAIEALDLVELTGLLRRAHLVLGGDTGPLHLAHALGRPVLCLMGPTDPMTCGPYSTPENAIWRRQPCSFCHKRFTKIMPCLESIPPEEVAERAGRILSGVPLPPAGPFADGDSGCLILH